MTPSAVSKLVARLEARLATQLVHRSTRKLQLTPEGQNFYERSVRVLADIDEAERCAAAGAAPRGRVRVNANVPFGHHLLMPLVPRFLELHPEVTLDIVLTDRVVDLMDERADIAIRWGPLPPSDLVARQLFDTGQAIVASPAYLERYGTPRTPQELEAHNRIGFNYRRSVAGLAARGRRARRRACRSSARCARATAKRCAGWCWKASGWRGSRCITSSPTSTPAGWCRCWRSSIRAT